MKHSRSDESEVRPLLLWPCIQAFQWALEVPYKIMYMQCYFQTDYIISQSIHINLSHFPRNWTRSRLQTQIKAWSFGVVSWTWRLESWKKVCRNERTPMWHKVGRRRHFIQRARITTPNTMKKLRVCGSLNGDLICGWQSLSEWTVCFRFWDWGCGLSALQNSQIKLGNNQQKWLIVLSLERDDSPSCSGAPIGISKGGPKVLSVVAVDDSLVCFEMSWHNLCAVR